MPLPPPLPLPRGGGGGGERRQEGNVGQVAKSRKEAVPLGTRTSSFEFRESRAPPTTNHESVSQLEGKKKEKKEGKGSEERIALLKQEECLARIAAAATATTIIMMAKGAGAGAPLPPPRSRLLSLSVASIVYFPPSTWSPFFRPLKRAAGAPADLRPSPKLLSALEIFGPFTKL